MSHDEIIEIDAEVGTDTNGTTEEEQPRDQPPHDTVDRCFDQLERLLLQEVPSGLPAEPENSPCTIFRIPQLLRGINPKAEEPEIVSIGPYHRGRPQVLEFERLKPLFLKRFLRRCNNTPDFRVLTELVASWEPHARLCYSEHVDLTSHDFLQMMLLDGCFMVEFLLHTLFGSGDAADKPGDVTDQPGEAADETDHIFLAQPQMIPILIRDLLKLENQIPRSVLVYLFNKVVSANPKDKIGSLSVLALKLFNQTYPRPMAVLKSLEIPEWDHLLDLFYMSLSPTSPDHPNSPKESWSSAQSVPLVTKLRPYGVKFKSKKADSLLDMNFHKPMPWNPFIPIKDFMTSPFIPIKDFMTSWLMKPVIQMPNIAIKSVPLVTELRPSGVKFKSKKADSLLDINFHKPMLWNPFIPIKDFMTSSLMKPVIQMPNIAINDFMTTVLINCVSLDQCRENKAKYMSDYVSFMHCLINQPKDVSLLRSDGIIALYSRDDQYVVDLFNKLGNSISFNVHDCFLSKQFEELESYYRSNWAKMMRTYFSSPWSFISAFSAFLIVVLSITQTIMAILTYRFHR
ncbi:hypothetical protein ACJRO7_015508 [Eucalyptus globulus]|uniref:Uncharacterized protein n=1 Tax=Eucalyptus globulus TaxID=34317 RepID=A0ABD3L9J8_EUCGL